MIWIDIYRTTLGRLVSAPPYWKPPSEDFETEFLRDLEIGDSENAALHRNSWFRYGVSSYVQIVEFSFRNILVRLYFYTTDESASEEQLDWLVGIAHLQLTKLQSMPLSDEFVGYW